MIKKRSQYYDINQYNMSNYLYIIYRNEEIKTSIFILT